VSFVQILVNLADSHALSLSLSLSLSLGMSAAVSACDGGLLDYTRRDWSRWDSFDLELHSLVKRRGTDAAATLPDHTDARPSQSPAESYLALLRAQTIEDSYSLQGDSCYRRFRCLQPAAGSCDDYIAHVTRDHNLMVEQVLCKMSFALNQEYNHWRDVQRQKARQEIFGAAQAAGLNARIDAAAADAQVDMLVDSTPFDFRTHPPCQPIIAWFHTLLDAHLRQQCLDPASETQRGKPWGPFKNFGLFSEKDGTSYVQEALYWRQPGIGFLYGHYIQLLNDDMLRRIRTSTYASLAAQYALHMLNGTGSNHHLESQWLLRIAGFVQSAFILVRSEQELKKRGTWTERDGVAQTDQTTGRWTNNDLIAFTESIAEDFNGRMRKYGQTEYLSSYVGYVQDLLHAAILHSPSQSLYDHFTSSLDRIVWDLTANLLPGCGMFPGPSARSYDLFAGAHNTQDRLDYRITFKHAFAPYCQRESVQCKTLSNSVCLKKELRMVPLLQKVCAAPPPVLLPPSGSSDVNLQRTLSQHVILAGAEPTAFPYIRELQLRSPIRWVEQRFSPILGQERCNFFSSQIQMGFSGEDAQSTSTSVNACARLAGAPVPNAPRAIVNHGDTECTSMFRLYPQISDLSTPGLDQPFWRDSPKDVAGKDRLTFSRQIATQYQGWMLTTSLLAVNRDMRGDEGKGSWNTNLVLPVNVEEVWADETRLSVTPGTYVKLPPQTIFTVRHGPAAIAVRLVVFTKDEGVQDAQRIEACHPGKPGLQPCSVTWQVDDMSVQAGCGRIVVHHRDAHSNQPMKSYRCAWLWGSGVVTSQPELFALGGVLRSAHVSSNIQSDKWEETNQPADHYPSSLPQDCTQEVGSSTWDLSVHIASGALKLGVKRTDVYKPWQHDPIYRTPISGSLHKPPFFFRDIHRTVNDVEILRWNDAQEEDPYRFTRYEPTELFEPHRQGGSVRVFTGAPATHFVPLTKLS
jgi:hypothetical protein